MVKNISKKCLAVQEMSTLLEKTEILHGKQRVKCMGNVVGRIYDTCFVSCQTENI